MLVAIQSTFPPYIPKIVAQSCDRITNFALAVIREYAAFHRGAYLNWWGKNRTFREYGINPTTVDKTHDTAVLILHGNWGNHSCAFPMAHYLAEKKYPVFTLSTNYDNPNHPQQIKEEMKRIQQLFAKRINLVIIGHSRGGTAIMELIKVKNKIGCNVNMYPITIASRLHVPEKKWLYWMWKDVKPVVESFQDKFNEKDKKHLTCIRASHDWLMRHGADHPPNKAHYHDIVIPGTSHFSVFFAHTTFKKVKEQIRTLIKKTS